MRRILQRAGDSWMLRLTAEQVSALGVDETNAAVLVRSEEGDVPRLVVRRAPTLAEAMTDTLQTHGEALAHLAIIPDGKAVVHGVKTDSEI